MLTEAEGESDSDTHSDDASVDGDEAADTDEAEASDSDEDDGAGMQVAALLLGVQSYDMQARQYLPSVGRFQGEDRYEGALADLGLQSDPLTQNRYAFAGGNPVSRVEWDGHDPCSGRFAKANCKGGLVRDDKGNVVGTPKSARCDCPHRGPEYAHPAAVRRSGEPLPAGPPAPPGRPSVLPLSPDTPGSQAQYAERYGEADQSEINFFLADLGLGPERGVFRYAWFIPFDEAGLPGLRLSGDKRGYDAYFNPRDTRATLEIDFSEGRLTVVANRRRARSNTQPGTRRERSSTCAPS